MKLTLSILFLQLCLLLQGQSPDTSPVLFTYEGGRAQLGEFKALFEDDTATETTPQEQDFLELFINYKLKLAEAKNLGLATLPAYRNEVENYKNQLVESFTQNPDVLPALVREAYERSLQEVRAQNLLIMLPPNAQPADTLTAFKKMEEALQKLKAGQDFTEVSIEYSTPKVKPEQVDLGYFSALQMVYPFENAAYQTPVGEVSNIFKSRFGYHILKVIDKRKANGMVSVKQIQLMHGENDSLERLQKQKIFKIYDELKAGAVFDTLAVKYSEDRSSASRGGLMQSFGIGQVSDKNFQEAAFALQTGEVSEPFESRFGWHILQMVKREPVGDFEKNKDLLEMRIQRDGRSSLLNDAKYAWLAQQYKPQIDLAKKEALAQIHPEWILDSLNSQVLISFPQRKSTQQDLLAFHKNLFKNPRRAQQLLEAPFEEYFKEFYRTELDKYHVWHLENFNEDFKKVFEKFKDGLLVYNVMESEVWKKSRIDSLGLKKYYELNADKFPAQPDENGDESWKTPALLSAYQDYYEREWLEALRKKYKLSVSPKARKLIN